MHNYLSVRSMNLEEDLKSLGIEGLDEMVSLSQATVNEEIAGAIRPIGYMDKAPPSAGGELPDFPGLDFEGVKQEAEAEAEEVAEAEDTDLRHIDGFERYVKSLSDQFSELSKVYKKKRGGKSALVKRIIKDMMGTCEKMEGSARRMQFELDDISKGLTESDGSLDPIDGPLMTRDLLQRIVELPLDELGEDDLTDLINALAEKALPEGDDELGAMTEEVVGYLFERRQSRRMQGGKMKSTKKTSAKKKIKNKKYQKRAQAKRAKKKRNRRRAAGKISKSEKKTAMRRGKTVGDIKKSAKGML